MADDGGRSKQQTCMTAVRNDCGLKSPGSQTDLGTPRSVVHSTSCVTRCIRLTSHELRGRREGYARFVHTAHPSTPVRYLLHLCCYPLDMRDSSGALGNPKMHMTLAAAYHGTDWPCLQPLPSQIAAISKQYGSKHASAEKC